MNENIIEHKLNNLNLNEQKLYMADYKVFSNSFKDINVKVIVNKITETLNIEILNVIDYKTLIVKTIKFEDIEQLSSLLMENLI